MFLLQALTRGKRVLVCAPSNVAVDNILERLVAEQHPHPTPSSSGNLGQNSREAKVKAVRIGHPARMSPQVHRHCLDALVLGHDGTEIVQVSW